jgi:hypothetical protein
MHSKQPSSAPILHPDGTLGARLAAKYDLGAAGTLLHFQLPVQLDSLPMGRFYLARCTPDTPEDRWADWSIYARRPLFVAGPAQAGSEPSLTLLLPHSADAGYGWLQRQSLETRINLSGPYGRIVDLPTTARTLLILCTEALLAPLLPFIHAMLDRGGRVTLAVQNQSEPSSALLALLPIAVEVQPLPPQAEWADALQGVLRWADHLITALDPADYTALAQAVRAARFRLEPDFALAFAAPDLLCGFGACLACVIPTADGSLTRACVHGPFFPLEKLVR